MAVTVTSGRHGVGGSVSFLHSEDNDVPAKVVKQLWGRAVWAKGRWFELMWLTGPWDKAGLEMGEQELDGRILWQDSLELPGQRGQAG